MNLFAFLERGTAGAKTDADRRQERINKKAEEARAKWINALQADECRAWLDLGQAQQKTLIGFSVMLALAGFVAAYDQRDVDSPDIRVIRGAISAIEQCTKRGHVLREVDVLSLQSAATRAKAIISAGSVAAICHAAESMQGIKDML